MNKLLAEDNCQRVTGMKVNPDMMRMFTCFIDMSVYSNVMIDAMRVRQLYGQEDWKDSGPMPQIKFKKAAGAPETDS